MTGSIVCFCALLLLLKVWRPKTASSAYGGKPVTAAQARQSEGHGLSGGEILLAWMPFAVLVIVVALWTGPWSQPARGGWFKASVSATAPETKATITALFNFAPWVGGRAILAPGWIVVALLLVLAGKLKGAHSARSSRRRSIRCGARCWSACSSSASPTSSTTPAWRPRSPRGSPPSAPAFIVVAPILGFIGVALSGSNTSTNAMFGKFQALVGVQLGFPPLLLPTLNSVGAEIGKPIAPQTASVGVSTSKFVRNEGEVIRHNLGWTFVLLAYLIVIGDRLLFRLAGAVVGGQVAGARAFSTEVETGSVQKMRQTKNRERVPIQSNRNTL